MTNEEKELKKPNSSLDPEAIKELQAHQKAVKEPNSSSSLDPEAIKELQLHRKAVKEDSSYLSLIREREIGIKRKVIETQIKADKVVAEAKEEVEKQKPQAETDVRKKVENYIKEQKAKIQKEAKNIIEKTSDKTKEAEKIGKQNFDKAISKLTDLLVPSK